MKIYEKPMAIVEKIEVEDVITASLATASEAEKQAILDAAGVTGAQDLILFQW